MTLHVVISAGGTSTADISGQVRRAMPTGGVRFEFKAEEGTVASANLYLDSTAASPDVVGLRRWWAWESAEDPGYQLIGSGYIGSREFGRRGGEFEDRVLSDEARVQVEVVDHNQLLSRRIITGSDGSRPAETDIARITWLLGSAYLRNVDNSQGYVDTTHAVSLDKVDLRGQSAYDILFDCAQRSNKNFHLIRYGDTSPPTLGGTDRYSLWYDYAYSTDYQSAIRLTNTLGEADNLTTFYVNPDATMQRSPERVYSGVLVQGVNVDVYQQDIDTANAFDYRDVLHSNPNVNTTAAATVIGAAYLDRSDSEEDRITCRYVVPKEKVNHLREGQACEFKFSHFPSYTTYTWGRVLSRSVVQLSEDNYEIGIVLVPAAPLAQVATHARLERPNDNHGVPFTWDLAWDYDGDNPLAGDVNDVKYGLINYYPVGAKPALGWEGLVILGDGSMTFSAMASSAGVCDGPTTCTIQILRNADVVASATESDGRLGTYFKSYEFTVVSGAVDVANGDVITAVMSFTSFWGTLVIPAGVGNSSHHLIATGSLLP